jgi:hypothetical protein
VKAFTVLRRQTAIDQLAEIWLAAADRAQITGAVEAIDAILSDGPLSDLTSELAEGLRTAIVLPLRVIYVVQEQDRIVDVATVRGIIPSAP